MTNAVDKPTVSWLQCGLQTLYEDKKLCDVIIQVHKEAFPCHRVVLSAASTYFDAMFTSGMKETEAEVVNIVDISPKIFKEILTFIYKNEDIVTTENVEELLQASCLFQIIPLKNLCEDFLLNQLSSENCVGFWVTGKSFSCHRLAVISLAHTLENFDEICSHEEIMRLEIGDFLEILQSEDLISQNEETVCRTALKWIKFDRDRRDFAFEILQQLRLCQVGLDFILDEIFTNPSIQKNENCIKLLQGAIRYHALPESRHMSDSMEVRLRNITNHKQLTLVLGKRRLSSREETSITEFIGYSDKEKTWYSLCSTPVDLGDEFAVCPLGNDIFVSGGSSRPESFFQFSAKLCKWIEKPSMHHARYRHCMVAAKNSLYVLGGYNFGTVGSVEEFDLLTNTWNVAGDLKHAVDAASVAIYGDKIYIFGGWQGFSEESDCIQCYDTSTHTCTVVGSLPSPQKDTRAVTYDNKTYIACTNGEILCYQPGQKTTCLHTVKDFNKRNFGLFKDSKSMCLLGGELLGHIGSQSDLDERFSEDIVHLNETGSSNTKLPDLLPVALEVYGCYRTVIRLKYPLIPYSEQFEFM